nr:cysteine hydrolase family protein [uncultured Sellimonas sp.]
MVLLVVDTQKALVNDKLHSFEGFVKNIKKLICKAREKSVEVIYVVHDDGPGSGLTKGMEEFEIYEEFRPLPTEKVFEKNVNSAFYNTGLLEYLKEKNQREIVVVGLQTDKCINATVISGFEHGFRIIVPAYANSTVDNEYMKSAESYAYFNDFMWPGRYAECITVEEMIQRMEE